VVKAFAAEGLTFPARHLTGSHAGELYWVTLRHDQALFVLHNPRYAGAYFYGRRRQVTGVDGRHRSLVKPRDEWTTFIPGAHVGYISLAQFEANQATLAANAAARGEERRAGPAREGPALLQGLVVCGRCGRRMTVGYHRRCDRSVVPDYACQREGIATGTPPCQRVCGPGVDEAVAALVLDALSPLALKTALAVSAELAARAADADVTVSARRTRIDWAHCIKELVDVHYPDAERVVLVHGNPEHPHARVAVRGVRAGRGQAAGRPAGAALHPKHGSWLNMAEIELAVLAGQCLDRRLADRATLQREVAAWQAARNADGRGVDWRFTTEDARIKLKHLYPAIQD
jgi:Recombinase zinc beta ribbon domain/Recombinase